MKEEEGDATARVGSRDALRVREETESSRQRGLRRQRRESEPEKARATRDDVDGGKQARLGRARVARRLKREEEEQEKKQLIRSGRGCKENVYEKRGRG